MNRKILFLIIFLQPSGVPRPDDSSWRPRLVDGRGEFGRYGRTRRRPARKRMRKDTAKPNQWMYVQQKLLGRYVFSFGD